MTNALPVHRLGLPIGARASAPAAYVRALDLSAGRLDQDYARTADEGRHQRYDYAAPVLTSMSSGLEFSPTIIPSYGHAGVAGQLRPCRDPAGA